MLETRVPPGWGYCKVYGDFVLSAVAWRWGWWWVVLRRGGGWCGGSGRGEAWDAGAVAVGEDVAALEVWVFRFVVLTAPPPGYFLVQSLRRKRVKSGLPSADFAVKCEGPAFGRACSISLGRFPLFLYTFNSSELSGTKMPVLADLFLACR